MVIVHRQVCVCVSVFVYSRDTQTKRADFGPVGGALVSRPAEGYAFPV